MNSDRPISKRENNCGQRKTCSNWISALILVVLLAISAPEKVTAGYFIIDPLQNTSWSAGQQASVRWRIRGNFSPNPKISVELIAGLPQNSQWVDTICTEISNQATDCSWTVPDYLPTMPSGYGVRINWLNGINPNFDYSPRFQIRGNRMGNDSQLPMRPAPKACITCNISPSGKDLSQYTDVRDPNFTNSAAVIPTTFNLATKFSVLFTLSLLTFS